MEINKETKFTLTLEFLIVIISGVISILTVYFTLKADIEVAKQMPKPVVTETEWQLKDQLIREAIINTQKDVTEINKRLDRIEERLNK